MIPDTISHFRVIKKLGQGGMGEVYLAEDLSLKRNVALKILPPAFTNDADRLRRFAQEARAAAALNHPNIAHIYEVNEIEGLHYIAMEYVEGETLRQKIVHSDTNLSDSLNIVVQMAAALSAAHSAGIVHRDIKPENVMIRPDGYIKVLDFGLAKLTESSEAKATVQAGSEISTITSAGTDPGTILGTSYYMSPEQARGQTVDTRSDLFSLGVVLYEMVARRIPFEGETPSDVIASILKTEPPPLSNYFSDIPAEVQRVVNKLLKKDREQRYQTAKDLLIDLKNLQEELSMAARLKQQPSNETGESSAKKSRNTSDQANVLENTSASIQRPTSSAEYVVGEIKRHKAAALVFVVLLIACGTGAVYMNWGSRPAGTIDSIAVLPFENVGADPETDYLSDGIAESIINNLSQIGQLRVVPRTSVFRYKGQKIDSMELGHKLGVRAVLTGRVVQRGDTLNIQADLVDVDKQSTLWGAHYERKRADILAVQDDISKEIADNLRLKLTSDEQKVLSKKYTDNAEAYDLYLKGRFYGYRGGEEDWKRSVEFFNRAIEKDPNYALAYAGRADTYAFVSGWEMPPSEAHLRIMEDVKQAIGLDDTLAEAHATLGMTMFSYDRNLPAAEKEIRRAIALNPRSVQSILLYAGYLTAAGRTDEAVEQSQIACRIDPSSVSAVSVLGNAYYYSRQFDKSVQYLQAAVNLDQNVPLSHLNLGNVYLTQHRFQEAIAEFQKARDLGMELWGIAGLGTAYAASGRKDDAVKMIAELHEASKTRYVPPYLFAMVYLGLGDKDETMEWLEKADQERNDYLLYLNVDPLWDYMRSDTRYTEFLHRIKQIR